MLIKTMIGVVNQVQRNGLKVALLGVSLATDNMGVSALAASLIKLVLDVNPTAEISLLIGNRSSAPQCILIKDKIVSVNVVNYRFSFKSPLNKHLLWIFFLATLQAIAPFESWRRKIIKSNLWLNILNNSDFVGDIRGGDSFSDIYGLQRFIKGIIPISIAILLKKNIVLLPQTYGPYSSFVSKKISKIIFKAAKLIYARDKASAKLVQEMLVETGYVNKIKFCPDVAFTLDVIDPEIISIGPPLSHNQKITLIGINVNGLVYNGGYTRNNMFNLNFDYKIFIQELIDFWLNQENCEVLLIPHAFSQTGNVNSDPDACLRIFENNCSKYKEKIHLVNRKYNQNEIKGIIKRCDFFIGTRMHACIAAISQGIPTVGVAYSKKFKGIFDSIGLGEWIVDAREKDIESSLKIILTKFQQRENYSVKIQERVTEAKNIISESFHEMLKPF
jgi:polysaccharide pyruvyl transferase WcaK-like protein